MLARLLESDPTIPAGRVGLGNSLILVDEAAGKSLAPH